MSKSSLSTVADVWNLLSEYVNPDERSQLADSVVMLLIEHDYELEDIRHQFDGDSDIIDAVKFYAEDTDEWSDDTDDLDLIDDFDSDDDDDQ